MNNKTLYREQQQTLAQAQQALDAKLGARAHAHITNARRIVAKLERNRSVEEYVTLRQFEWASPLARQHTLVAYTAQGIKFAYTMPRDNNHADREPKTFIISLQDLSTSVWTYNKQVRQAYKKARAAQKQEFRRAAAAQLATLREQIRTKELQAEQLTTTIEKLSRP